MTLAGHCLCCCNFKQTKSQPAYKAIGQVCRSDKLSLSPAFLFFTHLHLSHFMCMWSTMKASDDRLSESLCAVIPIWTNYCIETTKIYEDATSSWRNQGGTGMKQGGGCDGRLFTRPSSLDLGWNTLELFLQFVLRTLNSHDFHQNIPTKLDGTRQFAIGHQWLQFLFLTLLWLRESHEMDSPQLFTVGSDKLML